MTSHTKQLWLAGIVGNLVGIAPCIGAWLVTRIGPAPVPILFVSLCSMLVLRPIFRTAEQLAATDPSPLFKPRRHAVWYLGGLITVLQVMLYTFPWHHH